jgi:GDP-L-fucose synthase
MKKIIGFEGKIIFDTSKPDGSPRKLIDVSRLNRMGWSSSVELEDGLKNTYSWYEKNLANIDR